MMVIIIDRFDPVTRDLVGECLRICECIVWFTLMSEARRSQFNGVLRACIEGLDVAVGSRDLIVAWPFNEGLCSLKHGTHGLVSGNDTNKNDPPYYFKRLIWLGLVYVDHPVPRPFV